MGVRSQWTKLIVLLSLPIILSFASGARQGSSERPTLPRTKYHPTHVLVRFRSHAHPTLMAEAHRRAGALRSSRFHSVANLELVELASGTNVQDAIRQYRSSADVLYAEPDYAVQSTSSVNDPQFPSQWALYNTGQNGGTPGADIGAVRAWDITTGSSNIVVAVIDSGVDYAHPDLAANIFRNAADCNSNGVDDDGNGYVDDCYGINAASGTSDPKDDNGHGTHVAGIVGAAGNNAIGVTGVNWSVQILACKFLDKTGVGTISGAIACLDYVRKMKEAGVNIVATNNSWGGPDYSQALADAIEGQRQDGVLFIAAAGNQSSNNDTIPFYPASYKSPNVISVAATNESDQLTSFSNSGLHTVHLGSPGNDIVSTLPGNSYGA